MSALDERRREDLRKVQQLCASSGGKLSIAGVAGDPMQSMNLELRYATALDQRYPSHQGSRVRATITLSGRYPIQAPTVHLAPVVYHPNVFASGMVCLGTKWIPTEGLDLLVKRIAQIVTFDPAVLGEDSPANRDALEWYRRTKRLHPSSFPTDEVDFSPTAAPAKTMTWTNVETPATERVIISCAACGRQLRVPAGRSGTVRCPSCGHAFEART
jgi:ubiquitin-protein ligase